MLIQNPPFGLIVSKTKLILNYLYHIKPFGIIVSEVNKPASEASLANIGAKRQFFASYIKNHDGPVFTS